MARRGASMCPGSIEPQQRVGRAVGTQREQVVRVAMCYEILASLGSYMYHVVHVWSADTKLISENKSE